MNEIELKLRYYTADKEITSITGNLIMSMIKPFVEMIGLQIENRKIFISKDKVIDIEMLNYPDGLFESIESIIGQLFQVRGATNMQLQNGGGPSFG